METALKNNFIKFIRKVVSSLSSQFFAGLIVILPLFCSVAIALFLLKKLDSILGPLMAKYIGMSIPGLGAISLILGIWLVGIITTNYLGRQFVRLYESIIVKIPVINTLFSAIKQISDNLFSHNKNSFKQAVLVRSPVFNSYCIGFLTSGEASRLNTRGKKTGILHVFIPFTPPTSGFIIMVPKNEVIPLDLPVEDALKVPVSIGVIHPKAYNAVNFFRGLKK
jgi:uncharacterized membrane protein